MKIIKYLTPILLSLTVLASCYYDNKEALYPNAIPCIADSTVTFAVVSQVLKNNCASCHSSSTATASGGGIILEDSLQVVNRLADIINDISQFSGTSYNAMPKNSSKMDECSINQIKVWANKIANKTPSKVCDTTTLTFNNDILPIFQNKCASCHSLLNSALSGGGIVLQDSSQIIERADEIINDISQTSARFNAMPKNSLMLDNCSINQIKVWANRITKTIPTPSCDTSAVTYAQHIAPIIQKKCASCHSAAYYMKSGGEVRIATYDDVLNRIDKIQADVNQIGVEGTDYNPMPKKGLKLDNCSINKIQAWINQGYNP